MALPVAMMAALAMQALDRKRKQDEMRNQAAAEPYRQFAGQMGAPTFEVDAVRRRSRIDEEDGESYLDDLLPLLQQQQSGGRSR